MNPAHAHQAHPFVVPAAAGHCGARACRRQAGRLTFALCRTLLVLSALGGGVVAQTRGQTAAANNEPSRQPILRIETGMHTATIRRIGVDAAGRYLVTGSEDKTVRVWELATGRLLRVLRPPLGAGEEGKISAVALSPDGRTIAAGGWTGYEWDKQHSIYLFDRESGRLVRRLGGLPNVIAHLAFSPDGTGLAAALLAGNGIRVFRVADGTESGRDTDYGDDSYGLDFDRAGRLVTSCRDGYLRLYDQNLKLIKKVRAPGGQRPYAVRFAPDRAKVAVGYEDSARVDVLDGSSLGSLYQPDTTGVSNGDLSKVAWAADGAALYAGGRWDDGTGINPIRRWADAGRGRYQDLAAANQTIFDLAPLANGRVVFGAADPGWGVFSASGQRARLVAGEIADYRADQEGFLTDTAGVVVGFAYDESGKSPARFSLAERRLETGGSDGASLQPPRTDSLVVTDWMSADAPKLNGVKLALKQYERSRSLAIAPDAQRLLLGTEYYLRLFDRNGAEQWNVPAPSTAWSVNISGNGKLAIAAFGDGTIRWYRMTDGKELLAFFPHNDRKRWVLWTPQGYYDAAPGAEDLIGWHVNNGKDQAADFFPVGQFRSVYYRPDVISRVLTTGDEAEALRLADAEAGRKRQEADVAKRLPPVVEIVAPADGAEVSSTTVAVRYAVRAPSGEPVTAVKALVDGRPIVGERILKQVAAGDTLRVTIPERDCEVAVIAENQFAASVPATVRLRWRGRTTAAEFVVKPKLYVLAVGVSKYAHQDVQQLRFAAKDARDFAAALQRQKGGLYEDVVVKVLADEGATKDVVLDGFEWILRQTTSKDVAMILLAGHGDNDNYGDYFFCPHNIDPEKTLRTGVPFTEIKRTVERLAGKVVVFVDTCRSGNVFGTATRRSGAPDIVGLVNELASAENGAVVFAASTGRQFSYERAEWNNGAFTKAVLEGLSGGADFKGVGKITVNMLDAFISERVKELTGGKQTPTTTKPKTVQDFPIAVKK